jgi:oxygen-independent coproporphyrinogen-3 oxidase
MTPPVLTTSELLARYDRPGPRYTSYPTAVEFHAGVTDATYMERLARADAHRDEPLSVYVHLPFCQERCAYCGCNVVITKHRDTTEEYLGYLDREVDLLASHLPARRTVSQLHWGGGTPTYYAAPQLERIFERFARYFHLMPSAEVAIEIDRASPRRSSCRRSGAWVSTACRWACRTLPPTCSWP